MNIKRIYRGFCNIIKDFIAFLDVKIESHRKRLFPQSDSITIINTETGSNNLGDTIIMKYCKENLKDIVKDSPVYEIASHTAPSKHDIDMFVNSKIVIVCGTNFLSPRMAAYSVWKFDKKMIHSNNVMLMAVGWGGG